MEGVMDSRGGWVGLGFALAIEFEQISALS